MSHSAKDPGTGVRYKRKTKRIINPDGSFNVKKQVEYNYRDGYIHLVNMSWGRFLFLTFTVILLINLIFAVFYLLAGPQYIGIENNVSVSEAYFYCLYFSFQTFTTVGYGALSPSSHLASLIASFETVFGWALFAIVTGLLYGRFARPSARVRFSKNALFVCNEDRSMSLQFRIANQRRNMLVNLDAVVILKLVDHTPEGFTRNYFELPLKINHIHFFPLNWTIVHQIDESSPLSGLGMDALKEKDFELLVLITGFDDTFSQDVHTRYSYVEKDLVWNAKFKHPFFTNEEGDIIFPIHLLDEYENQEK